MSLISIWGKQLNCGPFVKAGKGVTSIWTTRPWFFMRKRKWTVSGNSREQKGASGQKCRRESHFPLRRAQLAGVAVLGRPLPRGGDAVAGNWLLHQEKPQAPFPPSGRHRVWAHTAGSKSCKSTLDPRATYPTPLCLRFLPCNGLDNFERLIFGKFF